MTLTPEEIDEIRTAKTLLENPGLAAKISNYIGSPIEVVLKRLPASWHDAITGVTNSAIEKALDVALLTMDRDDRAAPSNWWHKVAVGASGAAGGMFGLPALAVELPVSTTIILRSIADIARSEGEDLNAPDSRLQCLQVLALGGKTTGDDLSETGYFAARTALARAVSEAAKYLTTNGLTQQGAPALVRLISQIATRFSIVVSEKAAVQTVPVLGAVGGAVINTLFIDHFQNMGRGHFIIRRLERTHGQEEVRRHYDAL